MKAFLIALLLAACASLALGCVVDSQENPKAGARSVAPPDTCMAPKCYPDLYPPMPR